jgi:choline dehydrogenase-like flavoprotein
VHDLPGVGENLQDHLEVYIQYGSKKPVSVAPALKYRNRPMVGAKWLFGAPARARPTTSRAAASCAGTTRWPTRT